MKKLLTLSILFISLLTSSCKKEVVHDTDFKAGNYITMFAADSKVIKTGNSTTLRWDTKDSTSTLKIVGRNIGVGSFRQKVDKSGSWIVMPRETTTYSLLVVVSRGDLLSYSQWEVKVIVE